MRILFMDHYFTQDIESLRAVAGDELSLDIMSYGTLRNEALRIMSSEVATGLQAFASPENEPARKRYSNALADILADRFTSAPFDAVVMPSDTFFYVRDVPPVAHALGVPFIVVQKETTISDHTMREHAQTVRRYAPPVADFMTVCSERHKTFWLRAGGDPSKIEVTGQPRFDFYFNQTSSTSPPTAGGSPTVLFLSYEYDAYHPEDGDGGNPWEQLHRETEAGLHELARQGWHVLIKPHPQQSAARVREWRARAGPLWGQRIVLVDSNADVRKLIVSADVTVGFQSTALLEAMLAGRPTVYTGWDERAASMGGDLIPFHEWEDLITVVGNPGALVASVASQRNVVCSAENLSGRRRIAEQYLGPLDGHASERTLAILRRQASRWALQRDPAQLEVRARLAARRRRMHWSTHKVALRAIRGRIGARLRH